jgi:hypothetical protein
MSPERLTRVSIGVFIVVVAALCTVIFFQNDADATQRCIDKSYSEEVCSWR